MASNLKCYFPNGSLSPSVPCDPSANVTHCCLKKEQCLTNGICAIDATVNYGIQYGRGVCSDPTWQSPVCPKVCLLNQDTATNSSAHDFRANGAGIYECNAKGYGQEAEYCCESASEKARCCSTETAIFTMPAASLGPVAIYASTTSVSSISSTTLNHQSIAAETSTAGFTMASPSATTITQGVEVSRGGVIGAGVGGVLGASLLIGAVLILSLRKRKKNRTVAGEDDPNVFDKPAVLNSEYYRHEVDASLQRHELAAPGTELPTTEVFVELPVR